MKISTTKILLAIAFVTFWSTCSNAQKIQWEKSIGGKHADILMDAKPTPDYGFILAGSSLSTKSGNKTDGNNGDLDYYIWKMKENGDPDWQKSFGGSGSDFLQSIALTSDAGFILAGTSSSNKGFDKTENSKGEEDYWIIKLDEKGVIEWQKTIGGSQDDQLYVVHQTYDRGYILGGNSNSSSSNDKSRSNTSGTDFWVVKLDVTGKILWQETYDYGKVDILTSLIENEDHTLLLGGFAQGEIADKGKLGMGGKQKTQKGTDDYIALKISETGEVLWDKIVGSDGADILKKVIETRDGGYLMAGTSNPFISSASSTANAKAGSVLNNLQGNNKQADKAKNQVNDAIKEQTTATNKSINDTSKELTNDVKKAVGITDNSPLKIGSPMANLGGDIMNGGNGKSGESNGGSGGSANEKKLPSSRDKKNNYGSADFWIVKLKDEAKQEKVKLKLEASPNPTYGFTNVVIGYDFDTGTATVVDLAGRQLQQFEITSPTVPIDLTSYPEGIYVVNIKTYYQGKPASQGVKIIKGISKN